jgi:protein gp37
MGERSVIEWTDSTWNPWRGCDKVSPGCAHCYMFRDQRRYGGDPSTVVRAADNTFYAPIRNTKWAKTREACIAEKGRHYVFTCSWSDWFHEDADEWRREAWEIVRRTPQSTYQILTKRPERIAECLPEDWGQGYPNVWLGVTIENRRFVDRADLLRAVPAAVRFISAEPLLGPLVFETCEQDWSAYPEIHVTYGWRDGLESQRALDLAGIDWIITGGESGPSHRRFDPGWAIDIRDAAAATGTAFLHKQNGGPRPDSNGRLLDGQTWDEFPRLERA